MPKGNPEIEYKIASENIRWYSNIRFAQLTLFFALTAGLYSATFSSSATISHFIIAGFKAGGFLSALAFAYLEKRADDYWLHFMDRACFLEKELGYKQYSSRPARSFPTSTVIMIMYAVVGLFWLATILLT
jgi:hypothetical protein